VSAEQSESGEEPEEPWLSREEIVARDVEQFRRVDAQLQRRIEERCREAEERWKAAHPWLAPGWCVTVPVRQFYLPDPL
jgi:hypothetical protein